MSTVFDDGGSGSDSGSSGARRRRLGRLLHAVGGGASRGGGEEGAGEVGRSSVDEAASPSGEVADDAAPDASDEEAELARMRASRGYAEYAAAYSRHAAKAFRERRAQDAARAAEVAADQYAARVADRDDDDAVRAHDAQDSDGDVRVADCGDDDVPTSHGPQYPPPRVGAAAQAVAREPDIGGEKERRDVRREGATGTRPRGTRKPIDPKIVDDSSDDDDDDDDDGDVGGGGDGDEAEDDDEVLLGPTLPPAAMDAAAERLRRESLPVSHEARLGTVHDSQVCCVSLDGAGARLASASADASVRLWDFGSMDSSLRSFRRVEPLGGGQVSTAHFCARGGRILCTGTLSIARVLDRDARPLVETPPGDMYLVDMARTRGHVAQITAARWLPAATEQMFATAAADATVRVWDVAAVTAPQNAFDGDLPRAKQLRVIKLRTLRGGKTNATAMCVVDDGGRSMVALGCEDGSIKVVDPIESSFRPAMEAEGALSAGAEVTALQYGGSTAAGRPLVLCRSTDDMLRVFDLRRLREPLASFDGLPNTGSQTGVTFVGKGGDHFTTGTSSNRKDQSSCGHIVAFDTRLLKQVWSTAVERQRGSVFAITWHERINQIVYGCADGSVSVLYSADHSRAGVLRCIAKEIKKKQQHGVASIAVGEIFTPNALPMFRDAKGPETRGERGGAASRKRKALVEPKRADTPDASKMTSTFTKAFMQSKVKSTWADEDPREALLKYDAVTRGSTVFSKAYQATQPTTVLASKTLEQEEDDAREELLARNKRARGTGGGK